jgi:hypothetical protein
MADQKIQELDPVLFAESGNLLPIVVDGVLKRINTENLLTIPSLDTIDDLRVLENPVNGRTYEVKAHNTRGLQKNIGGGFFKYNTTPEFVATSDFSFLDRRSEGRSFRVNTSSSFTAAQRNLPKHKNGGASVISENGVILNIRGTGGRNITNFNGELIEEGLIGVLLKGDTNFSKFVHSYANKETVDYIIPDELTQEPVVNSGEKFFLLEDNGTIINHTVNNIIVGTFERIIKDGFVNPDMFGAIPYDHPKVFNLLPENEKVDDFYAVQKCFDNNFYSSNVYNGYYYTTKTIQLKKEKKYSMNFGGESGRTSGWVSTSGVIFTDKDINVIEIAGLSLHDCVLNTDTSLMNISSNKNHITADLRNFTSNRLRNCELNMFGSESIHKFDDIHNGFVIDDRDVDYVTDFSLITGGNPTGNTGTFHFSSLSIRYNRVNRGFWLTNSPDRNTSVNGLTVKFLGCFDTKQFVVTDRQCGNSRFEAMTYQMSDTMSWQQAISSPAIKVIGSRTFIDGMFMDAGGAPTENPIRDLQSNQVANLQGLVDYINSLQTPIIIKKSGGRRSRETIIISDIAGEIKYFWFIKNNFTDGLYGQNNLQLSIDDLEETGGQNHYMPNLLADFSGSFVQMGHSMMSYFREISYGRLKGIEATHASSNVSITNSDFVIPRINNFRQNGLISRLDNSLTYINRVAEEFYVKAFKAENTDLTLLQEKSEGIINENNNATVSNPAGCVDTDSGGETSINYNNTANVDTDYTEIYMNSNAIPEAKVIHLNLFGNILPKKVQFIQLDSDGSLVNNETRIFSGSNDSVVRLLSFDKVSFSGNRSIIFRLIGSNVEQGESFNHIITDIICPSKIGKRLPYLHRGGDQTILGDQTFIEDKGPVLSYNGKKYRLVVDTNENLTVTEI